MDLHINIQWLHQPYMAAGAMPARISITNNTAQTAVVPQPGMGNPFTFYFTHAKTGETVTVGEAERSAMMAGGAVPKPKDTAQLNADATLTYDYDLSDALVDSIAPGRYSVTAVISTSLGAMKSQPIEVGIVPADFDYIAHTVDISPQNLFSVAIAASGKVYASNAPARFPNLSVFKEIDIKISDPASFVLANIASHGFGGYWGGWLAEDQLRGAMFEANLVTYPFTVTDLGLKPDKILAAYQRSDGTGFFVVTGVKDGERQLRVVTIKGDNQWDVKDPGLTLKPETQVQISRNEKQNKLIATWVTQQEKDSAIITVELFSGRKPAQVATVPGEMLAWSVPMFVDQDNIQGYAITDVRTQENERQWLFQLVDLVSGQITTPTVLPILADPIKQWLLPRRRSNTVHIVAHTGADIKTAEISAAPVQWSSVANVGEEGKNLSLITLADRNIWLSWTTSSDGIVFHQLQSPSQSAPPAMVP